MIKIMTPDNKKMNVYVVYELCSRVEDVESNILGVYASADRADARLQEWRKDFMKYHNVDTSDDEDDEDAEYVFVEDGVDFIHIKSKSDEELFQCYVVQEAIK